MMEKGSNYNNHLSAWPNLWVLEACRAKCASNTGELRRESAEARAQRILWSKVTSLFAHALPSSVAPVSITICVPAIIVPAKSEYVPSVT